MEVLHKIGETAALVTKALAAPTTPENQAYVPDDAGDQVTDSVIRWLRSGGHIPENLRPENNIPHPTEETVVYVASPLSRK